MWQLRCIATWGRLMPCQFLSALITTPIPKFKSENLSVLSYNVLLLIYTLRYAVSLWPWPLTLNICSVSPVTWLNSVSILGGDTAIVVFDLMTLNTRPKYVSRVSLCSRIIFTKFELSTSPFLTYRVRLLPIRYFTLWPWPLTTWHPMY